jgi:hypothetical protein
VHRKWRARQHRLQQALEFSAARLEALPAGLAHQKIERRESRGHGDGVA